MVALHFLNDNPVWRDENRVQWEAQRSLRHSYAARIGHKRRRRRDYGLCIQPTITSLDPFVRLAEDISPYTRNILHECEFNGYDLFLANEPRDFSRAPIVAYSMSPQALHCPVREVLLPHVGTSVILLRWMILLAFMQRLAVRTRDFSHLTMMEYRQQTYTTMRQQLFKQEQLYPSDIIYAVAFAALVEHRLGNNDAARIHLQGCISMWARRRATCTNPLPFGPATTIIFDIALFGTASMLNTLQESSIARDQALVTLQEIEKWHLTRRKSVREGSHYPSHLLPGLGSALSQSLHSSIADCTRTGTRIALMALFTLHASICQPRFGDSDVDDFLQRLENSLSSARLKADENQGADRPVGCPGLLYIIAAVFYAEANDSVFEHYLMWAAAQFFRLLIHLPEEQWCRLKDVMASWIFNLLSPDVEILQANIGVW